ncbi:MAG: sulfatase [Verrucomicrobiales bacterium]|nr:sulfatase [Verrucomicrobiales bacterium]
MRCLALPLFTVAMTASPLAAEPVHRPNILFVLVDDFGARDLGCYGSEVYETPNMDRLAKSGVLFTDAYVAYPRCVPSRFAIMTGKHPARYQGDRDSVHVEPDRDVTFGQPFAAAGYETFYAGKWHLGHGPSAVGFTTTVAAGEAGAARAHFAPYNVSKKGGGEKSAIEGLDDAPDGEYLTDRLTEETMKFVEANQDKPFLAVLAHYAVHTPIEAKKHITKRYQTKIDGIGFEEPFYEPESAGENLLVQNNATYAAMIESVDKGLGRLLRQLSQLELSEKTIVVLCSDHGGLSSRGSRREVATSNRPFRAGKGHNYEGGLRVPLLIRWPGVTETGRVIETPVVTMDLFPTFLEIAELPLSPEEHLDGISLVPLLRDSSTEIKERTFFWHNPSPRPGSTADLFNSAMRKGKWKLLNFPEENRTELYDLENDAGESNNLAESESAKKDELLAELNRWRKSMGVSNEPRIRQKERDRQ